MTPFRRLLASYKLVPFLLGLLILLSMSGVGAPMIAWSQQTGVNPTAQSAIGTAFTYQGRLTNSSSGPVTGQYDFQFTLYDAESNGNLIGTAQTKNNVGVSNGAFTVQLDFGPSAFTGAPRWLALGVRPAGSGDFEALAPRQPLTPVPYAIYSDVTGSALWDGITGFGNEKIVDGNGIKITSNANSGNLYGVAGSSKSAGGYGVYGYNDAEVITLAGAAWGVYGYTRALGGTGVQGVSGSSIGGYGVTGIVTSSIGSGVYGYNNATSGTNTSYAQGVLGQTKAVGGRGLEGDALATQGNGIGVAGFSYGANGRGVNGEALANSGDGIGVAGFSRAMNGVGVYGRSQYTLTVNGYIPPGVWGNSDSPSGAGVYGSNTKGGWAAYFDGNVNVTGRLSKGSSTFKIDHPLDPENKYLSHSVVESPDMMNIYNGIIRLDGAGEAWVTMPAWFEALNKEFRYQLTPIGAPGPNLYIAQEIANNQFKIAGGAAGMKVSWQVTGIRHDLYAQAHPILVEEEKPSGERGTYLYPVEYGQPEARKLIQQTNTAMASQADLSALTLDQELSQTQEQNK